MDVSVFLDLVDRVQAKAETEKSELKAEMEAKLEAQRREMEAKLETQQRHFEAKLQARKRKTEQQREEANTCVSDAQLEALQQRFDSLHHAKLLTDDEVAQLEDRVMDFIECRSSSTVVLGHIVELAEEMRKLVGVCEGVSKDGMVARHLRRKFL